MGRKSNYDRLADSVSKRLDEMAPENCQTISECVRNDALLSDLLGMPPSTEEDYSYCPTCNAPAYHGICRKCN